MNKSQYRKYFLENKDGINKNRRKNYKKNREKILLKNKIWAEKHRKKCIDCGKLIYFRSNRCIDCQNKVRSGELHHLWKGDKVSYKTLHQWLRRHKPKPKVCEICKKNKPRVVANISGQYKRDIRDYKWLCDKCHYHFDR